jgi:hypothetical protein
MVRICVKNDRLPLAIYREVATHLAQIPGVTAICLPQTAPEFSYTLSQVGGLAIDLAEDLVQTTAQQGSDGPAPVVDHRTSLTQVDQILAYYSDRYGAWLRE